MSPPFSCLTFERFSEWVKGRPSKGTRNSINMQKRPAQNGQEKRATCFETLLQNEWNNDVARFTTLESNLSCNKSGCEKLLLKEEGSSTFCRKSVHVARSTDPKQICFAASDVTPVSGVTPA